MNTSRTNLKTNKVIIPIIIVIIAAVGLGVYGYSTAQVANLGQIANSIEKIHPQAIPVTGKVTIVDGVSLTTIAMNDESTTIDRTTGTSQLKVERGRATLELQHGVQTKNNIIAATITNNDKYTIYLKNLIIFGQTSEGMEPLNVYIVDASYSPEVFGNIPKPAITSVIPIKPGDSYSGYVVGKWDSAGMPIQSFSVGAVYQYDITAKEYLPDNNWSISTAETKIP
jgi:hypothetical protein